MRVALGADEATDLTSALRAHLVEQGHEVVEPVPLGTAWPEVGRSVAEAVVGREVDAGVVCCWTGTGVSIAANKVPGARAALCVDAATASGARRWNDANVLALSLRLTSPAVGCEIIDAFLAGTPEESERSDIERLEP